MRSIRLAVVMLAGLGLAASGCGLSDGGPTAPPVVHHDAGTPESDAELPPAMQRPSVDPLPNSVCADSLPLQGTAPAGANIFVKGGATAGITTDAHPVTGRFCVDVPLLPAQTNTFEVRAQDPDLGMSEPTVVEVDHDTCGDDVPDDTPEEPKSKNVALGASGFESEGSTYGNLGFLTDGDASTYVQYKGAVWDLNAYDGWVYITLDKLYMLEQIVLQWRDGQASGGTEYGSEYSVLVSSMSDPGDPSLTNGYWTEVATVTEGDGGTDTFDLSSSKPLVQHIAIWMRYDGTTNTTETFSLAELEAWDVPKKTNPTTPTNQDQTCASIGGGS